MGRKLLVCEGKIDEFGEAVAKLARGLDVAILIGAS